MKNQNDDEQESTVTSILIFLAQAVAVTILIACVALSFVEPKKFEERKVIRDVAKEIVAPHVVPFKVESMDNGTFATGFHMEFMGSVYLITNRHVCDSNQEMVHLNYAKFGDSQHAIIAIDTEHDLCILTSNRSVGLKLAAKDVSNLDKVILVGHPRGLPLTIRTGRKVEEMNMDADWLDNREVRATMISTITYGGNSGSPVTNEFGEVVGVLFAGDRRFISEGYYVPHRYLVQFLFTVLIQQNR